MTSVKRQALGERLSKLFLRLRAVAADRFLDDFRYRAESHRRHRRAAQHRFDQHQAERLGILNRIEQGAGAAQQFVAFRAGDETDILHRASVYQGLHLFAKIIVLRAGQQQAQTEPAGRLDGVNGSLPRSESADVTNVIVGLFPQGELRHVEAMRDDCRWRQIRVGAPLVFGNGGHPGARPHLSKAR